MKFHKFVAVAFVLTLSLVALTPCLGQNLGQLPGQGSAGDGLAFPQNPANWLNSVPLTAENLKGKAAFLYFYEES